MSVFLDSVVYFPLVCSSVPSIVLHPVYLDGARYGFHAQCVGCPICDNPVLVFPSSLERSYSVSCPFAPFKSDTDAHASESEAPEIATCQ